ncbi:MAG: Uma2 family endonuclease, partial [Spirochaetales bacterium]|nr:Uma2 family endonuclease [Spirochaetales bacterium]
RELIDGIVFNMSPAPSRRHQEIFGILFNLFFNYLTDKKCRVYGAPFDVRFPDSHEEDEAITTVVQPDILVVCDESKLDDRGMKGPPDLIIEITSPATSHLDLKEKFDLYERHGVKEYWIVHPYEETVMLNLLGSDGEYQKAKLFAGDDKIEVSIFKDLIIDLNVVFDRNKNKSLPSQ